jgi:hypothetical protein
MKGALITRGTCNLGKFNWYVGKQAALDGRSSLYPNIDFCTYPEAICSSDATNELKWTIAMFEWADRIQRYSSTKWSYEEQLIEFVDGGMNDDSFIDSVGRILTNGCHESGCSTNEVRDAEQRRANFYLILNDVFDVSALIQPPPQPQTTTQPSFQLNIDVDVSAPPMTAMPQPEPVLSPSYEITQPQPSPSIEVVRPSYAADPTNPVVSTEMPTYDQNETLIQIEGNGAVKLPLDLLIVFFSIGYFSFNVW